MKKSLLSLALVLLVPGSIIASNITQDKALSFLYKYMPLPDKADYDSAFYKRNIQASILARKEMPWGEVVPEREFMHFVLPIRVNNEDLDESRIIFYKELRNRVKHLSMKDAILEVNHWCHEKVTYTPSDERTSSPLASVKTAYGRCGEESTFTVAALRAVGIPARQVYTPAWAHTDDRHAWVEAWADGQWYFLGACEPEPVLNLGWFNAPASRGILMHTYVFGDYNGPEEVISKTPCFTEINITKNYAPTTNTIVKVVDSKGKPVLDADVEFKVYNYGEFLTISQKKSNTDGLASLEVGLGDLVVWGHKGKSYGLAHCAVAKGDTTIIQLDKEPGKSYSFDLTLTPPSERNTVPVLSKEQTSANALRLAYEDYIRNAYIATFDTSTVLLKKSRGNHAVIKEFLNRTNYTPFSLGLLNAITEKDLRDISLNALLDAYQNAPYSFISTDVYHKYVLSPRVANEMITPHRAYLLSQISDQQKKEWTQDVNKFIEWTKENIKIDTEHNPQHLRMQPAGVWKSRLTDSFSRNIFFVAMCRSLGIPARIDAVTKKLQYADKEMHWIDVEFDNPANSNTVKGRLSASYAPTPHLSNPKYYNHFTLSAIKNGSPVLMSYAEEDSYDTVLKNGTNIDSGDYLLISGTRMANGSVLAHVEIFPIHENEMKEVPLIMRNDSENLQVIGSFNCENTYSDEAGNCKSVLSTTGRGYFIVGLIAPNNEPTNHVLRDMALYKNEIEKWGRKILLLFRNKSEAERFKLSDFPQLPSNIVFGIDSDGIIASELHGSLPVIKIADTFNRVVFSSEGYTIGIGAAILKAIHKL